MRDDLEKQLNVAEPFPLVLTLAPLLLCTSLDSSNIPFFLPFFSLFFSLFLLPSLLLSFFPFSLSPPPPSIPPSLPLTTYLLADGPDEDRLGTTGLLQDPLCHLENVLRHTCTNPTTILLLIVESLAGRRGGGEVRVDDGI